MKNHHKMFMDIAEITAKQSNCVKYQVGSVVVKDSRIILQGYNGTVSGFINCSEKNHNLNMDLTDHREIHHRWSSAFEVHSEMNIICYAAKRGISLENTTLYCTLAPCNNCLKHLIQAGVSKVVYKNAYLDNNKMSERQQLLDFIEVEQYED